MIAGAPNRRRLRRKARARRGGRPLDLWAALALLFVGVVSAPAETIRTQRIGGLKAEIAALIVSGQEGGEIDMSVAAIPYPAAAEGSGTISFWLEARGGSILPEESLGRVEIYAYLVTPANGVADSMLETVPIETEGQAAPLRAHGLRFSGTLSAPPGSYNLRVLVREVESGRMGARTVPIEVSGSDVSAPRLLAPSTIAPDGEWFALAPSTGEPATSARTARPVLPADSEVAITTILVAGDALELAEGDGAAEIVIGDATIPAEIASRATLPDGAGEELTLHFDSERLGSGSYDIAVRLPGAEITSPPTTVVVAPVGEPTSWVALNAGGAPATATRPQAVPTRRQRRAKLDRDKENAFYLAALAALCDETLDNPEREADRLLREFERRVLREKTADVLPDLERLQAEVAERLAEGDPAVLAPIVQLHSRAYSHYYQRREFLLSTFTRRTLVNLGNLYIKKVGEQPSRTHGADIFTSIGAELQKRDPNGGSLALEMFKRALEADPTNTAAQIGQATIYERAEAYEDAVYAFKQILENDGSIIEARLRLALCELRLGRRNAGLRNLTRVTQTEGAPGWIRTIAYHELARWHLSRQENAEAIAALEEARAALPFDHQIHVLLAYAYDATGDPWTAREILAEAPAEEPSVTETIGDSPRRFYALQINKELAANDRRLEAWDRDGRKILRAQLERFTSDSARSR